MELPHNKERHDQDQAVRNYAEDCHRLKEGDLIYTSTGHGVLPGIRDALALEYHHRLEADEAGQVEGKHCMDRNLEARRRK